MSRGKTDEIKRLLQNGLSLGEIAKIVGVKKTTVRYHRNNLEGKPPRAWQQFVDAPNVGLFVETKPKVTLGEKRMEARDLRAKGYSVHEIAYKLGGVSSDKIAGWLE